MKSIVIDELLVLRNRPCKQGQPPRIEAIKPAIRTEVEVDDGRSKVNGTANPVEHVLDGLLVIEPTLHRDSRLSPAELVIDRDSETFTDQPAGNRDTGLVVENQSSQFGTHRSLGQFPPPNHFGFGTDSNCIRW